MSTYQHRVTGFFVKRQDAEIARGKLIEQGLPSANLNIFDNNQTAPTPPDNANSNAVLEDMVVDGAIGTAIGTGLGALGELALVAANVTLFVASPLLAPLAMLGWGAGLGAVVGAVTGAVSPAKKDGKLAELVHDAVMAGQVVLVATTRSPEETQAAATVIEEAVGSVKDVGTV